MKKFRHPLLAAVLFCLFVAAVTAQVVRPRPGAAPAPKQWEVPKDGALYVWAVPDRNLQTMIVLKVIDGETFEGAFLVPTTVRLFGVDAPDVATPAGKASLEALDKLIGGRLINASLRGKDAYGRQVADAHLGAANKDDPKQPSGWLSNHLVAQKIAAAWKNGPTPPPAFRKK